MHRKCISIVHQISSLFSDPYALEARPNTSVISSVLDKLVDRNTYDKRLRPKYGQEPVDVGITIHVSSISAVSEVDMVCCD